MTVMIRFEEALRLAAVAANSSTLPPTWPVLIIRDVYGRIRFAINVGKDRYPADARERLEKAQQALGKFATSNKVLFRDDFAEPDTVFSGPDWHRTLVSRPSADDEPAGDIQVSLLDRQITGQDWLREATEGPAHPHRLVFYGLKGGVGRSTALMMVAWGLAREGKRVLLVDFDLESPGLSSLVLPRERMAPDGLVDWFIEDAVGQGLELLPSMVSRSPLADTTTGDILVASAIGQNESDYMAKLARVYADVPSADGPQHMGARMRRILELLEKQEEPDVVLIDSRAGLHDLAAVAITSLADTAFLFATDSAHSWLGYEQLFKHWQQRPDVAMRVRERLAIVRALTPRSDRENGVRRFQAKAYDLFAECLYDEIPPTSESHENSLDLDAYFHPSDDDEAAPHFPILVDWDERFQEFDPHLRPENGGVTEAQIDATFGSLIRWTLARTTEGQT